MSVEAFVGTTPLGSHIGIAVAVLVVDIAAGCCYRPRYKQDKEESWFEDERPACRNDRAEGWSWHYCTGIAAAGGRAVAAAGGDAAAVVVAVAVADTEEDTGRYEPEDSSSPQEQRFSSDGGSK